MHRTRFVANLLAALGSSGAALAQVPDYSLYVFPPHERFPSVFATGMNERGELVGYAGEVEFDSLAIPVVSARDGGIREIESPTDSLNYPLDIQGRGVAIGVSGQSPYAWINGVAQPLLLRAGYAHGNAVAVSSSGVIVGSLTNDLFGTDFHVYWPRAGAEPHLLAGLDDDPQGIAVAVNAAGQIAGTAFTKGAVRWDDPTQPPLLVGGLAGSIGSEALGINAGGDVCGRSTEVGFGSEAFLYLADTGEHAAIGHLSADRYSLALAVNDARLVVGAADAGDVLHAFAWQDGELADLNDRVLSSNEPFAYLMSAVEVNNAGQIAVQVVVAPGPVPTVRMGLLRPRQ